MKTILIAHSLPYAVSGAELAIADMIDKTGKDFRCIMLTPGEGDLSAYYRRRGFEVIAKMIQTRRRRYPGLHLAQSAYYARYFRKRGIDGVVCNTFAAAARVGTLCRMAGIPHAVYVREYIRNIPLHRAILRNADLVFAVSADMAAYLREFMDQRKLSVAHDYINAEPLMRRVEEHRRAGTRLLPCDPGGPVVGFVGRLTPYKQPEVFIAMIPHVVRAVPGARFVVVGAAHPSSGDYEESLKKLAVTLGVDRVVHFMGQRSDAVEIISELSVLCLTSDREPFPRTVLEAQLAGCPVVAANSGGCPELVEEGSTGLLFDSTGPDAAAGLGEQVIRLLRDSGLAATLSGKAKQKVLGAEGSLEPVKNLERLLDRLTVPGTMDHLTGEDR